MLQVTILLSLLQAHSCLPGYFRLGLDFVVLNALHIPRSRACSELYRIGLN
jgi:hypothetical protein